MSIISGILQAVTPVIGQYAKNAVRTVFTENPTSEAFSHIADVAIDTACTLGVAALVERENKENITKTEGVKTSQSLPYSSETNKITPLPSQQVPIPSTIQCSEFRSKLQNIKYDMYLSSDNK